MDDRSIHEIVNEIAPLLIDRAPGKIFQFDTATLAIDFGLRQQGYLFISAEPSLPRIHLIQRRVRDLEKQSIPLNQFGVSLRKELANPRLISIAKDAGDRVVRLSFAGEDDFGETKQRTLIAQLTGRSANLILLDAARTVIHAARPIDIAGQRVGERYARPSVGAQPETKSTRLLDQIRSGESSSPSEAADAYFMSLLAQRAHESRANAAHAQLRKKIAQRQKLLKQLQNDLESHANAGEHKRIGDLLLANLSTAKRKGNRVALIDYFCDDARPVEIELDDAVSLQEEAQRRFALYQRSKRAVGQVASRIDAVKKELRDLQSKQESLEQALSEQPAIAAGLSSSSQPGSTGEAKKDKHLPGIRRHPSSDDFEILVGRTSKVNDHLTLKIAKPNDLWLHAADYGGSHVVVGNSTRKKGSHPTLIETAQPSAWFFPA